MMPKRHFEKSVHERVFDKHKNGGNFNRIKGEHVHNLFGTTPKVNSVFEKSQQRLVYVEKIEMVPINVKKRYGLENLACSSSVIEKITCDFYKLLRRGASMRVSFRSESDMLALLIWSYEDSTNENYCISHYKNRSFISRETYNVDNSEEYAKLILYGEEDTFEDGEKMEAIKAYGESKNYYVTTLSRVIDDFVELGYDFKNFILENGRPKETILHNNKEYPLKGFMTIAAIAKILGDCDFLGGGGSNTGFVLNNNVAEAICIDAGLGLRISSPLLLTSKDIVFATNKSSIIFSKLTQEQQDEFIGTLYKFIYCENLPALVEFMIKRNGAFNSQTDHNNQPIILLDDKIANIIIDQLLKNIEMLTKTYEAELNVYKTNYNPSSIVSMDEFNLTKKASEQPQIVPAPLTQENQVTSLGAESEIYQKEIVVNWSYWWPLTTNINLDDSHMNLTYSITEMEMYSHGPF